MVIIISDMAFKNTLRNAESDLEILQSDIQNFRNEFKNKIGTRIEDLENAAGEFGLLKERDLAALYQRVESLIEQTQQMIWELQNREGIKIDTAEAIQLTSTISMLELELNELLRLLEKLDLAFLKMSTGDEQSFIGKTKSGIKSALNSIRNVLKPLLIRFSQRLWKIISGLLTPKEWSISGELGNTVFGLGAVKIEVKFGPP